MVNGEKTNPIGRLQELTQKNWIRPPEYEFSDQENPSGVNSKMYSCQAKVATYSAEGQSIDGVRRATFYTSDLGGGLSKKIAKRQAATNLLDILENLDADEKKALLNRPEGQVLHPFARASNLSTILERVGILSVAREIPSITA